MRVTSRGYVGESDAMVNRTELQVGLGAWHLQRHVLPGNKGPR